MISRQKLRRLKTILRPSRFTKVVVGHLNSFADCDALGRVTMVIMTSACVSMYRENHHKINSATCQSSPTSRSGRFSSRAANKALAGVRLATAAEPASMLSDRREFPCQLLSEYETITPRFIATTTDEWAGNLYSSGRAIRGCCDH